MAQFDPRTNLQLQARRADAPRFELKIHELDPEDIEPNGDRYIVEVIDIDEKIELGQLLVVTQVPEKQDPRNPLAEPIVERRGVFAAVVIAVGNGHLLGLPDLAPVRNVKGYTDGDRPWATVDMFYEPGRVVFVDHNAKGRALKILGREVRIVNQIDILAAIKSDKLMLERTGDGGWKVDEAK